MRIAVLASFNMDLVMRAERRPGAGETLRGDFAMHLGGKGFNQAVAARRLGADVSAVGRVGDDEFGRIFLEALDGEGIDRRFVAIDDAEGTGVASVVLEPDGANTIVQAPRANLRMTARDVERASGILHSADVALFQLETSGIAAAAFAASARSAGVRLIFNAAPAVSFGRVVADVLVVNEIEAAAIDDMPAGLAPVEIAERFLDVREGAAVVTLGELGARWRDSDGEGHASPFKVDVVDTTGAGDAFCGALAVRMAEGAPFADAVRFANAAGALACTTFGAYPSMPRRTGVEALVAKGDTP